MPQFSTRRLRHVRENASRRAADRDAAVAGRKGRARSYVAPLAPGTKADGGGARRQQESADSSANTIASTRTSTVEEELSRGGNVNGWDSIANFFAGVCPSCCGGGGGGHGRVFGSVVPFAKYYGANYCGIANLLDYACLQASPCTGDGFMTLTSCNVTLNAQRIGLVDQVITATATPTADTSALLSATRGDDSAQQAQLFAALQRSDRASAGAQTLESLLADDTRSDREKQQKEAVAALGNPVNAGSADLSPKALRELQELKPGLSIVTTWTNECYNLIDLFGNKSALPSFCNGYAANKSNIRTLAGCVDHAAPSGRGCCGCLGGGCVGVAGVADVSSY